MSSSTKKKRTITKSTDDGSRKKQKDQPNVDDEMRMYEKVVMNNLQAIVDKLTRQVNKDWHNGCEKQAVTSGEWFMALRLPVQKLLDIGIGKKSCLKQCNELLKILSASWKDLNEVDSRVSVEDNVERNMRSS